MYTAGFVGSMRQKIRINFGGWMYRQYKTANQNALWIMVPKV